MFTKCISHTLTLQKLSTKFLPNVTQQIQDHTQTQTLYISTILNNPLYRHRSINVIWIKMIHVSKWKMNQINESYEPNKWELWTKKIRIWTKNKWTKGELWTKINENTLGDTYKLCFPLISDLIFKNTIL